MEKNISSIKLRILEYASSKGLSKRKIYLQTGLANGTLDKKTGLGEENIEKFISTFSDVNIEWLITGVGEMLKSRLDKTLGEVTEPILKNKEDELLSTMRYTIELQKKLIAELEKNKDVQEDAGCAAVG